MGSGSWETIFTNGLGGPGGTEIQRGGMKWQLGFSAPLETKEGATVSIWTAPRHDAWETRVIAVRNDGTEVANGTRSSANDQATWTFADLPLATVRDFHFQVRHVDWVEFRDIALAPMK